MKKIYLLMITVLFSLSMVAQQGGPRLSVEERAKRTSEWMKTELKLQDKQIAPVDSINLLFAKKQQALFQSGGGDREKIRESMANLEKEKETTLSKVLSAEQLKIYKEKNQELRDRVRGGGRP